MQKYVIVAILCIISTGISYCVSMEKYKGIQVIAFYGCIYAGVLSTIKVLLHNGNLSIFESFEEALPVTYLHYAVPLLALSILLPYIMRGGGMPKIRLLSSIL